MHVVYGALVGRYSDSLHLCGVSLISLCCGYAPFAALCIRSVAFSEVEYWRLIRDRKHTENEVRMLYVERDDDLMCWSWWSGTVCHRPPSFRVCTDRMICIDLCEPWQRVILRVFFQNFIGTSLIFVKFGRKILNLTEEAKYLLIYLLTYLLIYLLHGTESFLRSLAVCI